MIRIEPAVASQADELVRVRESLPMPDVDETLEGGFLLGTDADGYRDLVHGAHVWALHLSGHAEVLGLAVTWPDSYLRRSDIWQRRHDVVWQHFEIEPLEHESVAYFDQLAVLPRVKNRVAAAALALVAVAHALESHQHVFCTTVRRPVFNRAALSFLRRVGGRRVGQIDETYPQVGRILSDVHHIERGAFLDRIASTRRSCSTTVRRILRAARLDATVAAA